MKAPELRKQPWWNPGIWLGITFGGWMRLLIRNRFDADPSRLYKVVVNTAAALLNTALGALQQAELGRRVADTKIKEPPVFIIGHWRTGTTLLHELLCLDQRHTYPNNYVCLAPNHFLLTERIVARRCRFLVPPRRLMDNMAQSWDRPQEDEFALCNAGLPSPYLTIAFPNHPPQNGEYFDLEAIGPEAQTHWKRMFMRWMKQLTLREPKRIILKSPTHTFRIKTLLELFPQARFVHIVRNPMTVFPSTVHLWRSIYASQGLQVPRFEELEEYVFETFLRMHDRLEATRPLLGPGRFHELRYEDLVVDPIGQMQLLYKELELGAFAQMTTAIENYLTRVKGYKTNKYEVDADLRDEILRRWGKQIRGLGYDHPPNRA